MNLRHILFTLFINFSCLNEVRVSNPGSFSKLVMLLGRACKKTHRKMFNGFQSMLENLSSSHFINITKLNSYSKLGSCISFEEKCISVNIFFIHNLGKVPRNNLQKTPFQNTSRFSHDPKIRKYMSS